MVFNIMLSKYINQVINYHKECLFNICTAINMRCPCRKFLFNEKWQMIALDLVSFSSISFHVFKVPFN